MAPQENIPTGANVLGTIATALVCWCIQLLPQIWHSHRTKDTEGLPAVMVFLWSAAGVPLGIYAIVQNFNIPLQVQPQIFAALALACWAQVFKYTYKWSTVKATLLAVATGICYVGIEVLLVLTLRGPYLRGVNWPVTLVGIVAAVFLAGGLIPVYFEMWKRQGRVKGINFLFLFIDGAGAFFSLMALIVQNTFDVLGGVSYLVVVLLEIGIAASHLTWRYRMRKTRRLAREAKQTFDEYVNNANEALPPDLAMSPTDAANDIEKGALSQPPPGDSTVDVNTQE